MRFSWPSASLEVQPIVSFDFIRSRPFGCAYGFVVSRLETARAHLLLSGELEIHWTLRPVDMGLLPKRLGFCPRVQMTYNKTMQPNGKGRIKLKDTISSTSTTKRENLRSYE